MIIAVVAQLVERRLPKPKVTGSNPAYRSDLFLGLSWCVMICDLICVASMSVLCLTTLSMLRVCTEIFIVAHILDSAGNLWGDRPFVGPYILVSYSLNMQKVLIKLIALPVLFDTFESYFCTGYPHI